MQVVVLNGANLDVLAGRDPDLYGGISLSELETRIYEWASELAMSVRCRQSNSEGVLVDWIQEAGEKAQGVVLNAGAYTHTSIAIHDAIRAVAPLPVVEVHLSNIHAREPFRHVSKVAPHALGMICGFGPLGYTLPLQALVARI